MLGRSSCPPVTRKQKSEENGSRHVRKTWYLLRSFRSSTDARESRPACESGMSAARSAPAMLLTSAWMTGTMSSRTSADVGLATAPTPAKAHTAPSDDADKAREADDGIGSL